MSLITCIDIETTGLDVEHCGVCEIAGVTVQFDDNPRIVDSFAFLVSPQYNAKLEPGAMKLHASRWEDMQMRGIPYHAAAHRLRAYLSVVYGQNPEKVVVAGKNFGKFDYQFLRRLPDWLDSLFHHRFIDPAALVFDPYTDPAAPCLYATAARLGLKVPKKAERTALIDADLVAQCLLAAYAPQESVKRGGTRYYSKDAVYEAVAAL